MVFISRLQTRLPTLNDLNGQNPRQIAAAVLQERETGSEFTESLLERALARHALPGPDRALCQELVYGVVRWQATLDWLVSCKAPSPPSHPLLRILLRLGLYQIFWLDRIPSHAAVHTTVEMARQMGLAPKAGFVNAILRGCLREEGILRQKRLDLAASRPALAHSHPDWLFARWQARQGRASAIQLMEWNNLPPKTYARLNRCKAMPPPGPGSAGSSAGTTPPRPESWLGPEVTARPFTSHWTGAETVCELVSHPPLASLAGFQEGLFYIQDPSTLLAARLLDARPGETVLDLCAAPGGKTALMAQSMDNQGRIVATDISPARLERLRENCRRLGLTCVEPMLVESLDPSGRPAFDRILLDAPCSNTGVIRRRVDVRWRLTEQELARLQKTQAGLLQLAATLLKPCGTLVYSTCSLDPEENEDQVRHFLEGHTGFQLAESQVVNPVQDGVDGAFAARLLKQG